MTILVTGATGTVGRHVVAELLAAGENVRATTTRDPAATDCPPRWTSAEPT
ncbi:NAD-dependent epimerase/dehydratase family protein [Amycolatopsis suaedae]|uniref:NAD-dependent epimerase/dehydratase family protein n=1 Tax=Amycolatopsis suaedae TaxID=2510978 RepID=UPI00196AA63B|nr:NAD-dependent epimerase/dehydratase family protein [Amycolatopsis suaedae]